MFPIVSYTINARPVTPSDVTMSDVTGSSKLLVPGRVTSATSIPQGAMSMPVRAQKLRGQPDIVQISVGTNQYGTIELESSSRDTWSEGVHWIRAIRLSDDCHSYNVQLRFLPSPKQSNSSKPVSETALVLQCVRPVDAGQELLLWFSEDILAMIQMVFLTPANIQGQKKYVCTRCSALYESPNPLKLHITLGCSRYSIAWMWEKLSNLISESCTRGSSVKNEFNFKLAQEHEVTKQRIAIDLTTSSSNEKLHTSNPIKIRHTHDEPGHNSAFKPFQKPENKNNNVIVQQRTVNFYHQWPVFSLPQDYLSTQIQMGHQRCEEEAQIETLVSSLGKSKQGHICLYCGKCYSRKYGLKIHIRTHTGYKPLKCKYCLRPFGDPSNLNKHVRLHAAGDTPYKCDLCGKVLVRRRDLERHLKSRHMSDIHPENTARDDLNEHASDEDENKEVAMA